MRIKTYVSIALIIFILVVANIFIIGFFASNPSDTKSIALKNNTITLVKNDSVVQTQPTQNPTPDPVIVSTPAPAPTPIPPVNTGRRTRAS